MHNCWLIILVYKSGADVGHPGPGVATQPSMTGLVASVSPGAVFAVSYAGVQEPRVEMIQDLTTMVAVCNHMFDPLWVSDYYMPCPS